MQTAMADTTLPTIIDSPLGNQIIDQKQILEDRNDQIAYQYIIKGLQQTEIAKKYDITPQMVSLVCQQYIKDEKLQKRLVGAWKKSLGSKVMRTAEQLIDNINISQISDHSKVTDAAILIDKSLLLSGDSQGQSAPQINIVNYGELSINDMS